MKLEHEKNSFNGYYRVGYDMYSGKYLMEIDDTFGNNRYFIISEEQYMWYDAEQSKLDDLYAEFVRKNNQSEYFYFSNWEKENNDAQNELMWKYFYIDMLIGKNRDDIHKKIGKPEEVFDGGKVEKYQMSSSIIILVVYKDDVSVGIK